MFDKTQASDYEPLTRPRTRRDSSLEMPDEGSLRPSKFKTSASAGVGRSDNIEGIPRSETVTKPGWQPLVKEIWIVKRGHAISFAGLLIFTLLVYFRPYEWSTSLSWLSSSAYWVASLTLAIFIPTQLALENKITARPREVNLVLLLFVASLFSIPFASDPSIAWNGVTDYFKVVVIFIVMVNVVRTEKRMTTLFLVILIVSCVLSISAIVDYKMGNLASNGQRIKGVIGGLFDNPNDLALHLVSTIPIALALMLASRMPLLKAFYGICFLLGVGGVVVTFSRGGFLGMLVAGGVIASRLARRHKVFIPIIVSVVLVFLVVFAPRGYGNRLSTTSDGSVLTRTDDLKRSLYIAARHPFFGVGMDNYYLFSNTDHASHNAYTQVASELGLTAAVLYVMFLVVPLKQLRRISREETAAHRRSRSYYLAVGLEASLVGYMVSSFFASVAFLWYVYYLVAYAICLRRLHDTEMSITTQQVSKPTGIDQAFSV